MAMMIKFLLSFVFLFRSISSIQAFAPSSQLKPFVSPSVNILNGHTPLENTVFSSSRSVFVVANGLGAGRKSKGGAGSVETSALRMSLGSMISKPALGLITQVSPTARRVALIGAAAATLVTVVKKRQRLLWPGSAPDPDMPDVPLPTGSMGCPFVGVTHFLNQPGFRFYPQRAAELGNPKVWKMYILGRPVVQVTGSNLIKPLLATEFETGAVSSASNVSSPIFGDESLIVTQDAQMHSMMRQLVGASMTPAAIGNSIPTLEATAQDHVDLVTKNETVVMDDILTSYTLDIAWRQIIGLDLDPKEAEDFQQKVNEWITGIVSFKYFLYPKWLMNRSGPTKAYRYLINKVEERIEYLEASGPDKSTLSALLFAREESDGVNGKKKLSHQQVVDNALLLILAGSETSASTLTNCMLNLGLNKDAWQKIKAEQQAILDKDASNNMNATTASAFSLTRQILDKECPYLEAVIKETMRIRPISGGSRIVTQTQVVDGYQIPKGWSMTFNIRLSHQNDPKVRPASLENDADGTNNLHMEVIGGFQPERWMSEATRPSEFLSFGAGPRYCIGSNLALAEMKIFLALLAREVDFDVEGNIQSNEDIVWKKRAIIPKPEDGVVVRARLDKMMARPTAPARLEAALISNEDLIGDQVHAR
jgi:cytochrome P450